MATPETARVLFIDGGSRAELRAQVERMRGRLSLARADEPLAEDPAYSPRAGASHRLTLVASSNGEALARLTAAEAGLADASVRRIHDPAGVYYFGEPLGRTGKIAFLFPGHGSQYPGMLGNLHPVVSSSRWLRLVERRVGRKLSGLTGEESLSPIAEGWVAFAVGLAFSDHLCRLGVAPDMAAGHSFGEWSALLAMGYLQVDSDDEILESMAVLDRNLEEAQAQQGRAMAASTWVIGAGRGLIDRIVARLPGRLFLAADNSESQVVLGGFEDAVEQAVVELTRQGAICDREPQPMAPHTPLFEGMAERLSRRVSTLGIRAPRIVVYSGATASPFPSEPDRVRRLMARQWIEPVRFRELIEAMYRDGARVFVDVGPRGVLAGFVDDTLRGRPHAAVAVGLADRRAEEQLCHAVALLGAHHVACDLGGRGAETPSVGPPPIDAPTLPFMRAVRSESARALVASCELDVKDDLFLRDHTFGGPVSILDPGLLALPIVPFAVSLEMLAEAASTLVPHRHVIGLRDVCAHRFLAVDDDGLLSLTLTATEQEGGRVKVEIRQEGASGPEPLVEGTVLLGATHLVAEPATMPERPAHARPRVTSSDYEGPHKRIFHGPQFRSVHQLLWANRGGAETVVTPPTNRFFQSRAGRPLLLDPALIDGVGQSVGHWLEAYFGRWVCVLPCMVGEVDFYGPPPSPGAALRCVVTADEVNAPVARSHATLVGADGRLAARLKDWTDWTTFQPPRFRAFSLSPLDTFLSTPGERPGARELEALESSFIESMGGLWIRVLRALVLSAEERRAWGGWGASDRERLAPLMERIAAKDAIRSLLCARTGRSWGAADIDLGAQPSTPERIGGSWGVARVSVSRTGDGWSAMAREEPDGSVA